MPDVVTCIKQRFICLSSWLVSAHGQCICALILLATHAGLLAYAATQHSPTHLEPAFLAAGVSHWQLGRFELYRVNPPLPRMIAAIPAVLSECKTDWRHFYDGPGSRAEFAVGRDFLKANGAESIRLFVYARWMCIPFSLIGMYFAFRWANELYGRPAGLVTMTFWCFEPNLLAHAELVTPDSPCTAFGIVAGYLFWKWLKSPTWTTAVVAGTGLGLAELTKTSWLILFGVWPLLWLVWHFLSPVEPGVPPSKTLRLRGLPGHLVQLASILGLAICILNVGYGCDGSLTKLKEFVFVSKTLTGNSVTGQPGNRFCNSAWGEFPVPVPRQYLLGLDSQNRDLEAATEPSYLRGEWKDGGWWYYYLYGLLVKVPSGTWLVALLIAASRMVGRGHVCFLRDEIVCFAPAVVLFVIVSSQTAFNHHLRYVFPSLGFGLIFCGQMANGSGWSCGLMTAVRNLLLAYSAISCLAFYPHQLAYFNDFVGGPSQGHRHLLGSSFDWGQETLSLCRWIASIPPTAHVETALNDNYTPEVFEVCMQYVARKTTKLHNQFAEDDPPGVFFIASRAVMILHRHRSNHSDGDDPLLRPDSMYSPCTSVMDVTRLR